MDWQNLAPVIALVTLFLTILGVQGAMWWQLSSRIDALSTLLTDNLIALNSVRSVPVAASIRYV